MKIHHIVLAFIVGLSSYSQAQEFYAGGSVSFLEYSEDGIDDDADLNAVIGRVGTTINEYFSGEIRAGFGLGDDTVNVFGTDVDVELDNLFGAYVRGGIPVTEMFFPYAIIGYTRGEVSGRSVFGSTSESESDTSFGFGADLNITQNAAVNVEYINYLDKKGAEVDGFSIGVVGRF